MTKQAFAIIMVFCGLMAVQCAQAETWSEGTIDVGQLSRDISKDVDDFSTEKDRLAQRIKEKKSRLMQLKKEYKQASTVNKKGVIKSKMLLASSEMIKLYEEMYSTTAEKVSDIIPKIRKLRESAGQSRMGQRQKHLQNPETRKRLSNMFSVVSTLAQRCQDPGKQRMVADMLEMADRLYRGTKGNQGSMQNLLENMDQLEERMIALYAQSKNGLLRVDLEKEQTRLATEMFQYIVSMRPVAEAINEMDFKGDLDLPDIELDEEIRSLQGITRESSSARTSADAKDRLQKFQNWEP